MFLNNGVFSLFLVCFTTVISDQCPDDSVSCSSCNEECSKALSGNGSLRSCGFCVNINVGSSIHGRNTSCDCVDGFMGECCAVECPRGTFGEDCKGLCYCSDADSCSRSDGFCHGDCLAGFKGGQCNELCTNSTFGPNCQGTCGKCHHDDPCDIYTGICTNGCATGFHGDRCDEEYHTNIFVVAGGVSAAILVAIVIATIIVRWRLARKRNDRAMTINSQRSNDTTYRMNNETRRIDVTKVETKSGTRKETIGRITHESKGGIKGETKDRPKGGIKVETKDRPKGGIKVQTKGETADPSNVPSRYEALDPTRTYDHEYLGRDRAVDNVYMDRIVAPGRTDAEGYLRPVPSDGNKYGDPSSSEGNVHGGSGSTRTVESEYDDIDNVYRENA